MINDKKIVEIRGRIQTSALLTDHEKSDWLNLLELMNDKQLNELEEILNSGTGESGAASTAPAPGSAADLAVPKYPPVQQKMPPLNHISNLPTDLTMPSPASKSQTPLAQAPSAQPTHPNIHPPINRPFIPASPKHSSPKSTESPAAAPVKDPSRKTFQTDRVEDIQAFSIDTIRSYDLQSVVNAVRGLIQEYGYYKILHAMEASPLYDSYINSGQERLKASVGSPISNNSLLTQAEFEFMTDLLRHMRFNKW
jgi:hypothetical protein